MLALLISLLAFTSSLGVSAFCGGGGYDVTSAAIDMSVVSNGYTWWIHPCGSVAATSDVRCADPEEAPVGAMMCQRGAADLQTWVISTYNDTVARYQAKWWAIDNGVVMETTNGDICAAASNNFRTSVFEFRCDPSAITPVFVSASETETCYYQAIILTASACTPIGPTISNVVGSSFLSTNCGGTFYDFTSLRQRDMKYDGPTHDFWLRMCAYITAPECDAVQPTSFCQKRDNSTVAFDISDWNFTTPQLYTITPTGVDVTMREGDMCGNLPRRATYSLQCNSRARNPYVSYIEEYRTCHYRAVIQTSAVCTGTNDPVRGYCGGAGYSLSALQGADLTLIQDGYEWNLHPCGILSPWYTDACAGRESMFCQSSSDRVNQWSLATWNRNVSRSSTWIAIENGVQLYVSNSGEQCGGVIRDTTINFRCNASAIYPWFASVSEPSLCWYVAEVHTEFACDTIGSTAENSPGSSFWSSDCGGGIWDVSDIRDEDGDLPWDTNVTSIASGQMFYLELCGQVSHPACDSVQPTMFCQVDKASGEAWSISGHTEGAVQQYTINENGFTMSLQDGTPCGSIAKRSTDIQVVCDNSVPAYVSSLREIETCHYVAVVHGRCTSGSTEPFSSTGRRFSSTGQQAGSSSSSSLSGGAIAGIVIGSIVGALILLAILFVFCCGIGASGGRSKKGTQRFEDEEPSRPSDVEMEGTSS